MGGIGKTALALVLADKLKDRFPDGQLFLDMLGTSPRPLASLQDAMAHVIRSYRGADAPLPEDPKRPERSLSIQSSPARKP